MATLTADMKTFIENNLAWITTVDKDGNLVPVPVKVGDTVVYGKFGGPEINVEGEDVLLLRGDDLYAVFA